MPTVANQILDALRVDRTKSYTSRDLALQIGANNDEVSGLLALLTNAINKQVIKIKLDGMPVEYQASNDNGSAKLTSTKADYDLIRNFLNKIVIENDSVFTSQMLATAIGKRSSTQIAALRKQGMIETTNTPRMYRVVVSSLAMNDQTLTVESIKGALFDFHTLNHKWPSFYVLTATGSKQLSIAFGFGGLTWKDLDTALQNGERGLPGGDSLESIVKTLEMESATERMSVLRSKLAEWLPKWHTFSFFQRQILLESIGCVSHNYHIFADLASGRFPYKAIENFVVGADLTENERSRGSISDEGFQAPTAAEIQASTYFVLEFAKTEDAVNELEREENHRILSMFFDNTQENDRQLEALLGINFARNCS